MKSDRFTNRSRLLPGLIHYQNADLRAKFSSLDRNNIDNKGIFVFPNVYINFHWQINSHKGWPITAVCIMNIGTIIFKHYVPLSRITFTYYYASVHLTMVPINFS